jgi:Spy/CpxP family protein refolding chaperone
MKLSRSAIILYVGLVFASGAVLGVLGHRLYMASSVSANLLPVVTAPGKSNPEEYRKKALAEYKSRLKLTDDQVVKFNSLMDETRARVGEIRKQMHPAYEKIHQEQTDKVRAMLSPEQRAEYDRMLKERDERQKRNGDRGPGPGI